MNSSYYKISIGFLSCFLTGVCFVNAQEKPLKLVVEQITFGEKHHFFGYIGQSLTIPWNKSEKYIVAMESDFHDHMPEPDETARIIIIDTENEYKIEYLDETRAWNLQQGTMFYWNPKSPETQFFFNDRDSSGRVFTVLYDIEKRKRIKEYKFDDTPIGNGGVAPNGEYFLGINYARMDRLRPVTGYLDAYDWTIGQKAPDDDGIFLVNISTGQKDLIVSFDRLSELLDENSAELYINHTLWNRSSERIYFFARGRVADKTMKVNEACSMLKDGSELVNHKHIGGHPEWGQGNVIIGRHGNRQVLYDVVKKEIVGEIGSSGTFENPEGDISLSPNAKMFANGRSDGGNNRYTVYRMSDGANKKSSKFSRGPYTKGKLRIDPAPRWNRRSNKILVPGWIDDTRQLFIIHVDGAHVD